MRCLHISSISAGAAPRIPMSMGRFICVGVVVVCVAHMIDSVYVENVNFGSDACDGMAMGVSCADC